MINLSLSLANLGAKPHTASAGNKALPTSSQAFTDQLKDALAATFSRFGIDPAGVKLTVDDGASQRADPRQFSVTPQPDLPTVERRGFNALVPTNPAPASGTPPVAPAVIATPAATLAPAPKAATPAPAPTSPPGSHWYADDPADDAYWSQQPAAVRQLREIDDVDQRTQLGTQLASQGYSIDVPIMIWGWDAGLTTQLRQSYGYTWVPSAMSASVSAAPGLSAPGMTSYDPNHGPAGSIAVQGSASQGTAT